MSAMIMDEHDVLERFLNLYERGERFVVFDVETVGTKPPVIVEIGAIEAGREYAKTPDRFETVLRYRPDSWEPFWRALKIHKIPTREIEAGAPRREVFENFLGFVEGATLICHTGYDIRAMKQNLAEDPKLAMHVNHPVWDGYIDSCRLARKIAPHLDSFSLTNLSQHYGVHNPAAHRALADAITTKKVLARLLGEHRRRSPR